MVPATTSPTFTLKNAYTNARQSRGDRAHVALAWIMRGCIFRHLTLLGRGSTVGVPPRVSLLNSVQFLRLYIQSSSNPIPSSLTFSLCRFNGFGSLHLVRVRRAERKGRGSTVGIPPRVREAQGRSPP